MAVSLTLSHETKGADSSGVFTVASASFGTAATDRIMIAVVGWDASDTGASTLNSVTIGGISASQLLTISQVTSIDHPGVLHVEAWATAIPSGAAGPVVATFNANIDDQVSLGVFRLTGTAGSATPSDTATAVASSGTSVATSSVTIPTNGAALFAVMEGDDKAISWTNATEVYDHDLGIKDQGSGAISSTAGTPTVTATGPDSLEWALIGLAWAAASGGAAGTRSFGAIIG